MASLEVVLGRGAEEGTSPGATGQSWPGGLCAALGPPHEARECLEASLLGREGAREARRRGSHGAAGRRENPDAVNPAG